MFGSLRQRSLECKSVGLITGIVSVPLLVAVVTLISRDRWFPAGDMAQAELHMRGFLAHPPLVGAAGRIVGDAGTQGSHPGPALWVAMLPIYLLGARSSDALMAAVVSVHIVAILAAAMLAYRRGGRLLAALTGFVSLCIVRSSGTDFMIEPWNPWLAVLPFMVFVLLIAEVVAPVLRSSPKRRATMFILAVAVGSYCVQCHAGYVPLVLAALLGAFSVLIYDVGRKSLIVQTAGISLLVGLVMWSPSILDQWRRTPGNLSVLWQHFASPSEPTIAFGSAVRVIATQMNILGPWLTGPGAHAPSENWARYPGFIAFVALVLFVALLARRRGLSGLLRMQMMFCSFLIVAMVSVLRIFGPYFEYTIRWLWILSGLTIAHSCFALCRMFGILQWLKAKRLLTALGVAVVGALLVTSAVQAHQRVHLPGPTDSRIVGELIPQAMQRLDHQSSYLLRMYDPYTLNATGFGSLLELERQGFDVGVESFFAAAALPHRVRSEMSVDEILWVVVGPAIARADLDQALTKIAYVDPRTAQEAILAEQLLNDIREGLIAADRSELVPSLDTPGASLLFAEPALPAPIAEMVRQLILLGQPVAMYAVTPGTTVTSLN